MTPTARPTDADVREMARGLSEAQKRAIVDARDVGPFFVVDVVPPWPEGVAQFLTLNTDRLTPLGLALRRHLMEKDQCA